MFSDARGQTHIWIHSDVTVFVRPAQALGHQIPRVRMW